MRTKSITAIAAMLCATGAFASSHREAPLITETPKVDATDFYMFRSYEAGRADFVTIIANYQPLQHPYGGPQYYFMDPDALYEIHVDNNGDAVEDLTFQFRFNNDVKGLTIPVGGQSIPVPLLNIGMFGTTPEANDGVKNLIETYRVSLVRGTRRGQGAQDLQMMGTGATDFRKPVDNIGQKSIPNYQAYADNHIHRIGFGACGEGRVFVGQRNEGFVFNAGEVFDLINTNPLGPPNGEENVLADNNITTLALEVPIACLKSGNEPVIGGWTTASMRWQNRPGNVDLRPRGSAIGNGVMDQVSRLGAPLVNEVVIGLPDKDAFNASEPKDDAQFLKYVTNPSLPTLIEILFPSAKAPTTFPRTDLIAAFLTGVPGLNRPANVKPAEMLRLNTSTPPVAAAAQNTLGVIGGDTAGFPNGRRPGDDVIDIALRVMMGKLLPVAEAPAGQLPFTDGALPVPTQYRSTFP